MNTHVVHTILITLVFGLGAGIRYLFFLLIGRKKLYNDLIEPKSQDKWNILIAIIIGIIIVYLIFKYDTFLIDRHPPIDILMNRNS